MCSQGALKRVYLHMLTERRIGARGPLLVMLHWLGGSAHTWDAVASGLAARGVECAALNLPGFGAAADVAGYTVEAMADHVQAEVQRLRRSLVTAENEGEVAWFVAGHSMGGKVAAVLARRSLNDVAGLEGLSGLVLVSASPAGPEPMTEEKRTEALGQMGESTGDDTKDRKRAEKWVDENTGKVPLPEAVRSTAIAGVLEMNRRAFRRWMQAGSKEDWGPFVGQLPLPALIFAGSEDAGLGEAAQREKTLPHVPGAQVIVLQGAGHLAPMEQPGELVERITQFIASTGVTLPTPQGMPEKTFEKLMDSDHTSPQTLKVMRDRLEGSATWNYEPQLCSAEEFRTLRALAERVVPDAGFDLAARVDADVHEAKGDGWRYATLPPDNVAWKKGLRSLDLAAQRTLGVPFTGLHPDQQDLLLQQAAAGKLGKGVLGGLQDVLHLREGASVFSADEMKRWFEDVRAECTRRYVADPRTMDRMGYTGFADDLGFTQIRLGEQEEFER